MRILVCAVDSIGVMHQLIAIGIELARRGHDVAVASGSRSDLVTSAGLRHIAAPRRSEPTFQIREWGGASATVLQFHHVRAAVEEHRAQVVVTSPFGYGPIIAATELGLPLVTIGGLAYLWSEHGGTLAIAREQIAIGRRVLGLRSHASAAIHEYLGRRLLLQGIPELSGQVDAAVDARWIGDVTWSPPHEPDAELQGWCASVRGMRKRIVYVQLGREFGTEPLDATLAAIARSSELVFAVDTGRSDRPRKITNASIFARPFIAHAEVLTRADSVICTGQPTTVISALVRGLPLTFVPHGSGTETTAAACERAGVGRVVGGPVTVETLRECVIATADDAALRGATQRMGAEIAAVGGVRSAATFILEVGADA